MDTKKLLLKIDEASSTTGISRSALYQYIRDKKIEVVKVGRSTRIRTTELERFVDSLSKGTP